MEYKSLPVLRTARFAPLIMFKCFISIYMPVHYRTVLLFLYYEGSVNRFFKTKGRHVTKISQLAYTYIYTICTLEWKFLAKIVKKEILLLACIKMLFLILYKDPIVINWLYEKLTYNSLFRKLGQPDRPTDGRTDRPGLREVLLSIRNGGFCQFILESTKTRVQVKWRRSRGQNLSNLFICIFQYFHCM